MRQVLPTTYLRTRNNIAQNIRHEEIGMNWQPPLGSTYSRMRLLPAVVESRYSLCRSVLFSMAEPTSRPSGDGRNFVFAETAPWLQCVPCRSREWQYFYCRGIQNTTLSVCWGLLHCGEVFRSFHFGCVLCFHYQWMLATKRLCLLEIEYPKSAGPTCESKRAHSFRRPSSGFRIHANEITIHSVTLMLLVTNCKYRTLKNVVLFLSICSKSFSEFSASV